MSQLYGIPLNVFENESKTGLLLHHDNASSDTASLLSIWPRIISKHFLIPLILPT